MTLPSDHPDYYGLLGVPADASTATIKAAFKRLALRFHPDVYHGEDAQERMRHLLLAYRTLSDPVERAAYDARRAGSAPEQEGRPLPRTAPASPGNRAASAAAPGARRDLTRPYAFPARSGEAPVSFRLGKVSYTLSAEAAHTLVQQGYVRGMAPEATGVLPLAVRETSLHTCHRCHHRWIPAEVDTRPARLWELICPACHANDWGEYLLLRCIHCQAIFESEQICEDRSDALHRRALPYELFPLCPNCGAARWCPAEEARLEAARRQRGRKTGWFKPRS